MRKTRTPKTVPLDDPYLFETWLPPKRWEAEIYKAGFSYQEFCNKYDFNHTQLTWNITLRSVPLPQTTVRFRRAIEHARTLGRPPYEGKKRSGWRE